ncbi:MAG TPA: 16S rRNA (uracil(1498)-N(3))-methyltransferase [Jatrophihabitans sp.]|jgi:16S rRNA (uracil1498-N3)-methyltransferase
MTPALFLVETLPSEDRFELTGDEGRHAARVRRLAVGESLVVGDGRGGQACCTVAAVTAEGLDLSVTSRRFVPAPLPRLVVVQALPKGDRADLAVETMTELGVDAIIPWAAARSVTQWQGPRGAKALDKWRRTAREAAKQSRRAWVPEVRDPAGEVTPTFVLHESASLRLASAELPSADEILVAVGPEGGISDEELARFEAGGAVAVRLGEPVLRTSTAGAAALAVLSVRLGRWSGETRRAHC